MKLRITFITLFLTSSAFAQYGDYDDDVPAINEVRDALLAQKLMLDNYFSGYTAPNKLNDISNALTSTANGSLYGRLQGIINAVWGTSGGSTVANEQYTSNTKLENIRNLLRDGSGVAYLSNIQTYTDNIRNNTSNTIDAINYLPSQLDTDDDVPTLQNIQLGITDLDLHNQSSFASMITKLGEIKTALDDIESTPSQPTFTPPTPPTVTFAPDPVKTFAENAAEKTTPPVESDVTGQESGFEDAANDFTIGPVSNTSIPLLTGVTHSPLIGTPIATINQKMPHYVTNKIAPILRPILTGWLIFLCLNYTTKTSIRILGS